MRPIGNDRPTGKCLVHHKDSARMLDGTDSVRDQDVRLAVRGALG